jgi:AcrR family transcriptional regulator
LARPRSFDTDEVLTLAMLQFWAHGYEATSIRDLETATGLRAPSLYGAFGDKETLFTAALQRYLDVVIVPAVEAAAGLGLVGIRLMFSTIADKDPELPKGCLLAVTSSEAGALGRPPLDVLDAGLAEIRTALCAGLEQAIEAGALDPTVDAPATADALLALYQGIQVLLRSGPDHVDVAAISDSVLDRLVPAPPTRPTDGGWAHRERGSRSAAPQRSHLSGAENGIDQ